MEREEPVNNKEYKKMTKKFICFSHTRPDITYVVSVTSQFIHAPLKLYIDVEEVSR